MTMSQKKSGYLKLFVVVFMMFVTMAITSVRIHANETELPGVSVSSDVSQSTVTGYVDVAGNQGSVVDYNFEDTQQTSASVPAVSTNTTSGTEDSTTVEFNTDTLFTDNFTEEDAARNVATMMTSGSADKKDGNYVKFVLYHVGKDKNGKEVLISEPVPFQSLYVDGVGPELFALYPVSVPNYEFNGNFSIDSYNKVALDESLPLEALFDRVFDLYIYYDYVETGDPEIGDKVLESDSSDKFYMYMDVTDPYGKPVHLIEGAESYLGTASNMYIDGKLVWCVEPEVPTGDGSKYIETIVEADDSTRYGAIVTQAYKTYETSNKELILAVAQGLIWQNLGYDFNVNKMRISYVDEEGRRQLRELTWDEIVEIDDFMGYVNRLYRSYTNDAKANFALVTGQTEVGNEVKYSTVPGGIPSLIEGKLPEYIMFTGDKLILNLYKHGVIQMPEGVTAEIDEAAGLIKLILDPSLKAEEYYAYFSMIEEDMLGDSVLFTSKYDKQKLMRYGLDKAIRESLKFVIRPQGKPTLPDEPNEPEKPNKPDKPNKPNKPNEPSKPNKPNKPNEPEKPEVPKQPESVKSTQSVSEIPTATSTNTFAFVTMSAIALVGATFVLRRKEY